MNNDDTLISQLISETYIDNDVKEQPNTLVDLRHYFEKRLNEVDYISITDYIRQHQLESGVLVLQKESRCYRLQLNGSVLDFPSNWSIFKEVKDEEIIYLDSSLDQDFLLDIFSEVTGSFSNLIIVREGSDVKLIFTPEATSRDHIQWVRGYFEKKNQAIETKEAA